MNTTRLLAANIEGCRFSAMRVFPHCWQRTQGIILENGFACTSSWLAKIRTSHAVAGVARNKALPQSSMLSVRFIRPEREVEHEARLPKGHLLCYGQALCPPLRQEVISAQTEADS